MNYQSRGGIAVRGDRRRTVVLVALLTLMAMFIGFAPSAGAVRLVDPLPNPAFPAACGIDVAIVLDTSGSITNFNGVPTPQNEGLMKEAAKGVVDHLQGTPSRIGVVSFRTLATLELGTTSVADGGGADAVRSAIDAVNFGPTDIEVGTNWEDAFLKTAALSADVVLFATDGNPTTRNDDYINDPGYYVDDADIDAGVAASNALKTQGIKVVAIGIGNVLDVDNLKAISGPVANDDYYLSDFASLEDTLQALSVRLCAKSLTVLKTVDGQPASGWAFGITHDGADLVADPADGVTGTSGTVNYRWSGVGSVTATVTETLQPGYRLDGVSCSVGENPLQATPTDDGLGVTVAVAYPDNVQCVFSNVTMATGISLEKVPSVQEAKVGDTVTYTYTVTNTGELEISGLTLEDDVLGTITLASSTLAPGASTTGTATHVVTADDLAGPIVNVATAEGTVTETGATVTAEDDASVDLVALTVVKVADQQEAEIGDTITYTYTITNVGSATVVDLVVVDDILGPITPASTTLAPGESTTGTATHIVTGDDLPGPIVNVVTVTGQTPDGTPVEVTDDETVPLTGLPAIGVVKVADVHVAEVGDTVTYTYTVTNTGGQTLTDVTVVDDILGSITLATTSLAPGESTTGTATHVVTADDLAGPIVNVATASGTPPQGGPVTATSEESVALAAMDVVKVSDVQTAGIGDTITYTYTVTNTGSITLTDVTVVDDIVGPITLAATTLAPGESTTGTATYVVSSADGTGPVVNVALGTGTYTNPDTDEPGTVEGSDTVSVSLVIVLETTITSTTAETLPKTGADLSGLAAWGVALSILGGLILLALRRRETDLIA